MAAAARLLHGRIGVEVVAQDAAMQMSPALLNSYLAQGGLLPGMGDLGLPEKFQQCRRLEGRGGWIGGLLNRKWQCFSEGFRFLGQTPELKAWIKKADYPWRGVSDQVWQEWLLCDNVVACWRDPVGGKLPAVMILRCEDVEYSNPFGAVSLKVKLGKFKLTDKQKLSLGAVYSAALEAGQPIPWGEKDDEHFRVLTTERVGNGLRSPRLHQIFRELSTLEVQTLGDWNLAWKAKDVIRQYKRGHEIKQGNLAGQPMHFLKKKEAAAIRKALEKLSGGFDLITNFDVAIDYVTMDPKVFDGTKYEGTLMLLREWGGALAFMMQKDVGAHVFDALRQEGMKHRELVTDFLEGIFNHESFDPPARLRVGWNPGSFEPSKLYLEWLRFKTGAGLMSPQSAREDLALDEDLEGGRMEEAAKNRERYTPPFEAKQGMAAGVPGRPEGAATGDPKAE